MFALTLRDELETITVLAPGWTTSTDDDGNPIRVAASNTTVADVDIHPASGSMDRIPEAIRAQISYVAYVDLSDGAAAKRAALKTGRTIQRSSGEQAVIRHVADWSTHLVLALETTQGAE